MVRTTRCLKKSSNARSQKRKREETAKAYDKAIAQATLSSAPIDVPALPKMRPPRTNVTQLAKLLLKLKKKDILSSLQKLRLEDLLEVERVQPRLRMYVQRTFHSKRVLMVRFDQHTWPDTHIQPCHMKAMVDMMVRCGVNLEYVSFSVGSNDVTSCGYLHDYNGPLLMAEFCPRLKYFGVNRW